MRTLIVWRQSVSSSDPIGQCPWALIKMELDAEIEVKTTTVACHGGGELLEHPNVYLHMDKDGYVVCPYCSRRFRLKEEVAATKP